MGWGGGGVGWGGGGGLFITQTSGGRCKTTLASYIVRLRIYYTDLILTAAAAAAAAAAANWRIYNVF